MARIVTLNATVTVKVPKGIKGDNVAWASRYISEALMNKNRVQTYAVTTYDVTEGVLEIDDNGSVSNATPPQQDNAGELAQG